MLDQIIEAIKFLMRIYDLFSDEQKETAKTQVADGFESMFRKFFKSATDEASQA